MNDNGRTMNGGTLTGASSAASSETNARLIERFYTAFGRRDVDAMLACYHPQVVFSDAEFHFADALIVRHVDRFSLWRWAAMALGAKGALLGWVPSVRGAIRAQA